MIVIQKSLRTDQICNECHRNLNGRKQLETLKNSTIKFNLHRITYVGRQGMKQNYWNFRVSTSSLDVSDHLEAKNSKSNGANVL